MPGLRNPLSVSGAYERLRDVLDRVHDNKQDPTESGFVIHYSDLTIQVRRIVFLEIAQV
jgi:hypothetical protein